MKVRILLKSGTLTVHLRSLFVVLLMASGGWAAVPQPLVEFLMNAGTGTSVANTGSTGGSATRVGAKPEWSTQASIDGANSSLDFGTTTASNYAVDLVPAPTALKNLKSFTLSGWVNCRSSSTGGGGNRIMTWIASGGGHGVDLSFHSDGRLQMGVNEWNDGLNAGVASNGGRITTDATGSYNNWRFFAITYNSTLSANHVKFYFGSNTTLASLDVSRNYSKGNVGATIAGSLTIGHHDTDNRPYGTDQMFRGLVDNIRIHGSTVDGSGSLSLAQIREMQNATILSGPGALYEEWAGVSGNTIASLTGSSNFPANPSATRVRSSFDGFVDKGDNFGVKMSGWVKAPQTGNYVFWIASDNNGELRISTDANPVNKVLRASVSDYTGYLEWTKFPEQQSAPIPLVAGQFYYIEALMKEGTVYDNLSVGWKLPDNTMERPIPSGRIFLQPDDGDALFPSTTHLYESGTTNKKVTFAWQKEPEKDHFVLSTEVGRQLAIHHDVVNLPKNKLFFGEIGEQNDLGFRYWKPGGPTEPSTLYLETDMGDWAMKVEHEGVETQRPFVEFNEKLRLSGPEEVGESTELKLEYNNGLSINTIQDGTGGDPFDKYLNVSPDQVYLSSQFGTGGSQFGVSAIAPGAAYFSSNMPSQEGYTSINGGVITANEVVTNKWRVPTPDYVFEKGYKLRSLEEIESFVKEKKHLPDIPSAKVLERDGMSIGEMNLQLLKTVEELTLHVIEMNKEIKRQKARNEALEDKVHGHKGQGKGR